MLVSMVKWVLMGHLSWFLQASGNQSSVSGRARRDAAARAMQGWHSQRLLGNGEVGDPIIKVCECDLPLLRSVIIFSKHVFWSLLLTQQMFFCLVLVCRTRARSS